MALTPAPCRVWIGQVIPGLLSGETIWFNGDPGSLSGGTSFAVPGHFPGDELLLTACGTGDAELAVNLGGSPLAFQGKVPNGFFPGWPTKDFARVSGFDPATAQGSAGFKIGGASPPVQGLTFFTTIGLIQSGEGHTAGAFYVEYVTKFDLFSNLAGVGVSRRAPDLSFWPGHGRYSVTDNNGGLAVNGGFNNTWTVSLFANNVDAPALPAFAVDPTGTILALAIYITEPTAVLIAPALTPVALSCVPCCPLTLDGKWPGRIS